MNPKIRTGFDAIEFQDQKPVKIILERAFAIRMQIGGLVLASNRVRRHERVGRK
jgi:hypothetical protein